MRSLIATFLVVGALTGSQVAAAQERPRASAPEATIYRTLVRHWHGSTGRARGPVLVATSTGQDWAAPSSLAWLRFLVSRSAADSTDPLIAAFVQRNAAVAELDPTWAPTDTVQWLGPALLPAEDSEAAYAAGWNALQERYPGAKAVYQFSRVVFTAAGDSAFVVAEWLRPPPDGQPGCRTGVMTYWLTRAAAGWQVALVGTMSHYSRAVPAATRREHR